MLSEYIEYLDSDLCKNYLHMEIIAFDNNRFLEKIDLFKFGIKNLELLELQEKLHKKIKLLHAKQGEAELSDFNLGLEKLKQSYRDHRYLIANNLQNFSQIYPNVFIKYLQLLNQLLNNLTLSLIKNFFFPEEGNSRYILVNRNKKAFVSHYVDMDLYYAIFRKNVRS